MICEAKYVVKLYELGLLSGKFSQATWSGFRFHLAEPKASHTVKDGKAIGRGRPAVRHFLSKSRPSVCSWARDVVKWIGRQ